MSMPDPVYPNNRSRFPAYGEPEQPLYGVPQSERRSNLALNNAAEQVGNMVGSAVERVKELPDRLQEMKQRLVVIRGRTQADLANKAEDVTGDVKRRAQQAASQARSRAMRLSRENPLGVIASSAAVGMMMGIALRIWRDHAD